MTRPGKTWMECPPSEKRQPVFPDLFQHQPEVCLAADGTSDTGVATGTSRLTEKTEQQKISVRMLWGRRMSAESFTFDSVKNLNICMYLRQL